GGNAPTIPVDRPMTIRIDRCRYVHPLSLWEHFIRVDKQEISRQIRGIPSHAAGIAIKDERNRVNIWAVAKVQHLFPRCVYISRFDPGFDGKWTAQAEGRKLNIVAGAIEAQTGESNTVVVGDLIAEDSVAERAGVGHQHPSGVDIEQVARGRRGPA